MRENMAQYLKSLSPQDFENIKKQKGGIAPSSSQPHSSDRSGIQLQDLSEEQLDDLVQAIIANPERARNILRSSSGLGHISSEQIDKQIEMLRGLDADSMKATIKAVVKMQKMCQPLIALYNRCDAATRGYAKYVFGLIMLVVCVCLAFVIWQVLNILMVAVTQRFFGAQTPTDTTTATPSPPQEVNASPKSISMDEFEF